MILSMTGFGRGTAVCNGREIAVELRSVNSRYFEYSSRIPRSCSYMDSRLKKQLNERISRGKVELSMTVQNVDAADTVVASTWSWHAATSRPCGIFRNSWVSRTISLRAC